LGCCNYVEAQGLDRRAGIAARPVLICRNLLAQSAGGLDHDQCWSQVAASLKPRRMRAQRPPAAPLARSTSPAPLGCIGRAAAQTRALARCAPARPCTPPFRPPSPAPPLPPVGCAPPAAPLAGVAAPERLPSAAVSPAEASSQLGGAERSGGRPLPAASPSSLMGLTVTAQGTASASLRSICAAGAHEPHV